MMRSSHPRNLIITVARDMRRVMMHWCIRQRNLVSPPKIASQVKRRIPHQSLPYIVVSGSRGLNSQTRHIALALVVMRICKFHDLQYITGRLTGTVFRHGKSTIDYSSQWEQVVCRQIKSTPKTPTQKKLAKSSN